VYKTKNIRPYIVFPEESLVGALKKINSNQSRIIFVVSEHGILLGAISDGDVRRWLTNELEIDLSIPASELMTRECMKISSDESIEGFNELFINGITCIPVVNDNGRLVELAFKGREGFFVVDKEVSESSPSYIIAEVGNNHQGDIKTAKELVDCAVNAGVDCVKFQMRNVQDLYKNSGNSNDASVDLGAQYTMDLLSKFQLANEDLFKVFDYCKAQGIVPLCTPWDLTSLDALENYGMPAYKVASADFTNFELLKAVAETGKPFFLSTGMSSEDEIISTVLYLKKFGANFVLLHCNSTYPTPFKDVQLNYLGRLKKITDKLVGYSGHERGIEVPLAAVALGACVIEKHITLDKELEGNDHKVSLLPEELIDMVRKIRNIECSLGHKNKPREITQGELMNRENLAKSLISKVSIKAGETITRDLILVKSPGQGLQPNKIENLIGTKATRDIEEGDFFYESDISGGIEKRSDYKFSRPFGVPVRYHDYRKIVKDSNLDFVEFHLSYKDLEVDLDKYFSEDEDIGFAVHSPELFANDHILDLGSLDEKYRLHSISLFERVIDVTRRLKLFFPKTELPVIILNAGGWDNDRFLSQDEKFVRYSLVSKSLKSVDLSGVEIAIQTMPPFPWHFGGQSHHNLFLCADEIVTFCESNPKIKICLDISHTMMACNYYGWSLDEFIAKTGRYVSHLHVVDAKGSDGEGIEIGKGDVDFWSTKKMLSKFCPEIQFIPEVWQGHKNGGEGFWTALNFLEKVEI
jgi:N-acetylneuraminate synthase